MCFIIPYYIENDTSVPQDFLFYFSASHKSFSWEDSLTNINDFSFHHPQKNKGQTIEENNNRKKQIALFSSPKVQLKLSLNSSCLWTYFAKSRLYPI